MFYVARSSDSDAGRSNNNHGIGIKLEELEMHFLDAKPVKNPVTIVQHMVGGEVYVQEWEVINSGDISWDSNVIKITFVLWCNLLVNFAD